MPDPRLTTSPGVSHYILTDNPPPDKPPEPEPTQMNLPLDDPLLDFYAEQYAARTGDNPDTARRVVDGRDSMQVLLGRTDEMSYAEACATAGIPVPDQVPAARVIELPEPAEVPAIEVDAPAFASDLSEFDAGADAALEFIANGLSRLEVSFDVMAEAALERGHDLNATDAVQWVAGVDAIYANLAASPDVPEPVVEDEADPGPHPVRHTGDDELPDDSEEVTEADLSNVVPIRPDTPVTAPAAMGNTAVRLIYAARTTTASVTVLTGECTDELVARLTARLEQGLWLIPEQIGLTRPPRPQPVDHHDHPWVEVECLPTNWPPTQSRSFAELVADTEAVPTWDAATFAPTMEEAA